MFFDGLRVLALSFGELMFLSDRIPGTSLRFEGSHVAPARLLNECECTGATGLKGA